MKLKVSVEGAEEIDEMLAELPIALREKTLAKAMRKAAAAGRKIARARAPKNADIGGAEEFPELKKSVKSKVKSYSRAVVGIVGVTTDAPHGHLVEFGHQMVLGGTISSGTPARVRKAKDPKRTGKGRIVGTVSPHPWWRPAEEEAKPEIERLLIQNLADLVAWA